MKFPSVSNIAGLLLTLLTPSEERLQKLVVKLYGINRHNTWKSSIP